jgi:hypothetical protein
MKERILLVLSLILVVTSGSVVAQTRATKTVTNSDLEKFRQKRVQAEADYRANYEKLGMPSPEELEEREEESRLRRAELVRRAEAENEMKEDYFLSRANELKTQIASVDAQINYLRGHGAGQQSPYKGGTIVFGSVLGFGVGGSDGYGYYGNGYGYGGRHNSGVVSRGYRGSRLTIGPNVNTVRSYANSFPRTGDVYRQIYGDYPQRNDFRRRHYNNRYGSRDYYRGGYITSPAIGGYASTGDDLESRLSNLQQERAGLLAEWQTLAEEARRAGVKIE